MFIKNFGLFWRADEVDWNPGHGARDAFRLLGRRGTNRPGLRLADFRHQQGIYILYGEYGPHYVGRTKTQGFGKRLKDHRTDVHAGKWDRFSWFGFRKVQEATEKNGLHKLGKKLPRVVLGDPSTDITDIEALLIRAMGLRNIRRENFADAEEWTQIKKLETEEYLDKVA